MNRKEKIYISGAMTGVKREVFMQRFLTAENKLKEMGYRTSNPVRSLVCNWKWLYKIVGYRRTLFYDLWLLSRCDRIYLMPEWDTSKGARIESFYAYNMKIKRMTAKEVLAVDKALGMKREVRPGKEKK